ncbi:hypothetical protein [Bacillus swezeyi]|uniref:hypothetical protein n=1 Tax=Bacillus swezeyi TaxID=1925020 RepID=UPI00399D47BE
MPGKKKKLVGVLILALFLFLKEVLDSAWDKFGLVNYMIGDTDPTISIGMDETKSEERLREYLDQNLPQEAKEKYDIEIIQRDIEALEKEVFGDRKQEKN